MIQLVTVASVRAAYEKPAVTLDARDDSQIALWADRLSVSADALHEAVAAVGPSLAAIRRHLTQ